jgi:adenosine deaminase
MLSSMGAQPRIKMRRFNPLRAALARLALSLLLLIQLPALVLQAQQAPGGRSITGTPEQKTARYFESIRKSPPQMLAFLLQMPKGGDLHNHLSGAIYAESYIQWAANKGLCINQTTMALSQPPCEQSTGQAQATAALTNSVLYRQLIDAWSMRYWQYSGQNGHDHFFDTFSKFGAATVGQTGMMLAEVAQRAAKGRVTYLELMLTPDGFASGQIGQKVGWDGSFEATLNKLKSNGIDTAAAAGVKALREAEADKDRVLKCGTPQAEPGCAVTIRYISQVSRGAALGVVFAQMVTGFALANDPNSKVVALNLVQPEDGLASMQNFSLHMKMLNFLRTLYPKAHITLHAGELAPGVVPPEGLSFHIRESVMVGHAERIGHGVSIMHEDAPYDLLKELARRGVMVEICLTSNDVILGVTKQQHPLSLYIQYGVPVALATDDEGVSRSEISREFLRAAEEQGLGYLQLKTMARTSLQYAFIPDKSLWSDAKSFAPVPECRRDVAAMTLTTDSCRQYLAASEKARLQWKLEEEFKRFETQY